MKRAFHKVICHHKLKFQCRTIHAKYITPFPCNHIYPSLEFSQRSTMSDLSDWEAALTDEEEAQHQKELEQQKLEAEKRILKEQAAKKEKLKKENEEFEKMDDKAKKLKLREIELKNDAQNTLDLFGVSPTKELEVDQNRQQFNGKIQVLTIPDVQIAVDEISNALEVSEKIEVDFYQALMKELLKDVGYMEIREITSSLDTMANEKQRQEKGNKKKKKKAQVTVGRASDMREFEDFI